MIVFATFLLATLGVLLILIAGIGVVRLPDLPTRMHAASKAGSLGAALFLGGVAIHFQEPGIVVRAALVMLFLVVTAGVAAHVIARAAYRIGIELAPETVIDELANEVDGPPCVRPPNVPGIF